jgi:hypothetical protein
MSKIVFYGMMIIIFLLSYTGWYMMSWLKHLQPHFHANFAMYINWTKFDFSKPEYMEPVASCKLWWAWIKPSERVHLHEKNGDTVHVHADWVTWGHFFANNGMTFSNNHITLDDWRVFNANEKKKITFVLDWVVVDDPFNKMIESEDRLLINFWEESEDSLVKNRFPKVKDDAWEFNTKYDPASCSWHNENKYVYLIKEMVHMNHSH